MLLQVRDPGDGAGAVAKGGERLFHVKHPFAALFLPKSLFKIWRNARQAQIFSLGKAI